LPSIDLEGELEIKKILNLAVGYLQQNVLEVTAANIDLFLKESVQIPKVLLFTDKPGTPTIYKGLSIAFEVNIYL